VSLCSGTGGGPAAAAVRPERDEPPACARADRPRPVVCVIEHLHRDRSVADAVLAGRYHHAGVTLELGPEPDWRHGGLPADEEWRIEWSKFYEGLDLAHTYRQSGDPAYLDAWVRLVDAWIRQVPAGADPSDVIGRRVQNWVYAWQGFAAAPWYPGLPDGFGRRLLTSLAGQLDHLEANLTRERNHRTLELYGLLVVSLALPALDPDGLRARSALAELHRNLLTDVWPDGTHRECSTHYHMIALRSFVGARRNAARYGLAVPAGYDTRLAAACEFAMHVHRPDGNIPAVSDADSGSYLDVLDQAATLLGRSDLRWVASRGQDGRPPSERHASFPVGGYHTQRSGWGDRGTPFGEERLLLLDCGPLGDGGHGHYDLLSVEVHAGGRPLLVDPGRYTYSERSPEGEPNWRHWFKGTAAHNTVTVDGLDQTPYHRGKPKGPVGAARLLGRQTTSGLDVLSARATSPAYDAVHDRQVAFVAGEYWLIADALRASERHRYEQRWHLDAAAWGRTRVERREHDWVVHAPGLALVLHGRHEPRLEDGWVSERYGVKRPAPVVIATREGRAADFLALVWPARAGAGAVPRLRVGPCAAGQVAATLEGVGAAGGEVDQVAWSPSGAGWVRHPPRGARPAARGRKREEDGR
jgi:Heparinase II/III-like protein/Heparinase II/III N-terminus